MIIAGSGSVDIAQMLINRGANVDAFDKRNKTRFTGPQKKAILKMFDT